MRVPSIVVLLACSCGVRGELIDEPHPSSAEVSDVPSPEAPPAFEQAPDPSAELPESELDADLPGDVDSYFAHSGSRRVYVQLDRPMYRPGESVWVKSFGVLTRGLTADTYPQVTYELLNPRRQVVQTKQVTQSSGTAHNDFVLDAGAPGGRWTLRARLATGETHERAFVVSSYQTPRLHKSMDFVREAYGPGDTVEALVQIKGLTGEALANHPVSAMLQVDGESVFSESLTTDATGAVFIQARLADALTSSDGLLTVFVEQGGITESISRSVPIVVADVGVEFFPEGGDLVAGLPARVYFRGRNQHGEPADVQGIVRDDRGQEVATFESLHDGLGRFAFTPEAGRLYSAEITSAGADGMAFALPQAVADGCVLRSYDDVDSALDAVRVAVRCTTPTDLRVLGVQRETVLDDASITAGPTTDTVVYLSADDASAQGAVRVTAFNAQNHPVAERLVYRNAGRDLQVVLTVDADSYGPRDEVVVGIQTTDSSGTPVAAELALSVVDDAVVSLADDKSGHLLSRLYMETELSEVPKEPAFYFDADEELASRGLDLVMGTYGWRRFDWAPVWAPSVVDTRTTTGFGGMGIRGGGDFAAFMPETEGVFVDDLLAMPRNMDQSGVEMAESAVPHAGPMAVPPQEAQARLARVNGDMPQFDMAFDLVGELADEVMGGGEWRSQSIVSPVRVFPKPNYAAGFTGTRTDFRDTVHWEPVVTTDEAGEATVRFYLSDALTQFRVTAEGIGGGLAGHAETTLSSTLPMSLSTTLPTVVASGDTLWLPMTVQNTRDTALSVDVSADIESTLLTVSEAQASVQLAGTDTQTHWVQMVVGEGTETASITMRALGGGLSDVLERELEIVAPGFPRSWSGAGESAESVVQTVMVDEWVTGSLTATVSWQPSPTSTLITGMDALIRKPGGCFEQTSSTNWPNVAILKYLEAHDGDPRLRLASSQALDQGYGLLTGYQVVGGGFETFGSGPGKEALSAFGLLQFQDMSDVYDVDEAVLQTDATYLLGQRNGRGGFENTGESSHGYGSAPADVLDGFITWALVASGYGDQLTEEVAQQAATAETSSDPYVLALAARTLVHLDHPGASSAVRRLLTLQSEDGSFPGAQSSITRSYEANLLVESTALAALALMEAGAPTASWDAAADWLVNARQGVGSWGATQATALALGALTEHADRSRRPQVPGRFEVVVNGRTVGSVDYKAGQTEAPVLTGWEDSLRPGENTVELRQLSGTPIPFTVDVAWTSVTPDSSPGAELSLATSLASDHVSMGDTVRLTATIGNDMDRVVPSPIARIGLPAGLEAQTWQLQQMQDRGEIAFFETRPREVTLYWQGLLEGDSHEVSLDLLAAVPGSFTGPASSAYPYYNDDEPAWQQGLTVTIDR